MPQYLHPPAGMAPLSPAVLAKPLVLEIGAGRGKHAKLYSAQHPTHHLVAVERTKAKARDLLQLSAPNLTTVHADAIPYSVFALPPKCLLAIYILYPNPEPKNPNQRFVNMPFFEFLLSRLQAKGQLFLASNEADYIDEALHQCREVWRLPCVRYAVPPHMARTHFEIKYLARQANCQEICVIKPVYYRTHFDDFDNTVGISHA